MSTYQQKDKETLDYLQPIEIAQGIFWVGFADVNIGLRCNPYLIVDGDEAVLIDGGSRDDFSTVMMKILRTGLDPSKIQRLIYQHFDPDLCGNLPHLEAVIDNKDLQIISHRENNVFIHFYSTATKKLCIETMGYSYTFGNGRRLEFIMTPYAHAPGNFMTYDCKTKTLFTSDIFGSYDSLWSLYLRELSACEDCSSPQTCYLTHRKCPIRGILSFHERVMNSAASLRYALEQIESKDVSLIAPQHGSLIRSPEQMKIVIRKLKELEHVGFDYFMQQKTGGKDR
ncbi:MAG: MBL fold metallo-hydrolase [Anaerovoracaceae bacterium]